MMVVRCFEVEEHRDEGKVRRATRPLKFHGTWKYTKQQHETNRTMEYDYIPSGTTISVAKTIIMLCTAAVEGMKGNC
jgi:hypothetical protein